MAGVLTTVYADSAGSASGTASRCTVDYFQRQGAGRG